MTVGEVADLLIQDYGVYNALNLDGGGSTSMAMQDPATGLGRFVNVSSDNPSGRAEGSNLAVFAISVPEPVSLGYLAVGVFVLFMVRRRTDLTR
jgi:hypothetical protein